MRLWTEAQRAVLDRYMTGELTSREAAHLTGKTRSQVEGAARYHRAQDGRRLTKPRREALAREIFLDAVRPS